MEVLFDTKGYDLDTESFEEENYVTIESIDNVSESKELSNKGKDISNRLFLNNDISTAVHLTASTEREIYMSSRTPLLYILHKLFNPFVDKAVYPLGTSYSNFPIPDAFVPSLEIATSLKYPLPKLRSQLSLL